MVAENMRVNRTSQASVARAIKKHPNKFSSSIPPMLEMVSDHFLQTAAYRRIVQDCMSCNLFLQAAVFI
jgi:hypothetical protein